MPWVRVYKYLHFVRKISCPYYEPYSDRDRVCKHDPRTCKNKEALLTIFRDLDSVLCFFDSDYPR